jgi:hypothetical protein
VACRNPPELFLYNFQLIASPGNVVTFAFPTGFSEDNHLCLRDINVESHRVKEIFEKLFGVSNSHISFGICQARELCFVLTS